jgi:glycosyltransferase involved in cell wall biosynthesis
MASQKLKILLSAFVCHPDKGSEEGMGWNWLKELSKEHEVYALISCFLDQEAPVRAAVSRLPHRENIHLTFIPMPPESKAVVAVFPSFSFYNQCVEWQKHALKEAEKLLETIDIDIIHHVTYGSWLLPNYLWKLSKPFVLGPVSGSQRIPLVGYSFLPAQGIMIELIRMAYFFWARLTSVASRAAVRKAKLVLCSNLETLNEISSIRDSKTTLLMSDSGISFLPQVRNEHNNLKNDLKSGHSDYHLDYGESTHTFLFWAGLIEPRKNFGLLLKALQTLPSDISWKLLVAGEGPLLPYWIKKVNRLGLQSNIEFLGQVPYRQMQEYYQKADIFVFPSLREGSPTVILEAMAYKLPVIGLKLNGTATVLSQDCGVLIDVKRRTQLINDFANAITRLARDHDLRRKIGERGYERVKAFYTWEERGKKMSSLYHEVLTASPAFEYQKVKPLKKTVRE